MFNIDTKTKTINITRGDTAGFKISAKNGNSKYIFKENDVLRFKLIKCNDCSCVLLNKDIQATGGATEVQINLLPEDTRKIEVSSKPIKLWYEIELNPEGATQTIIGYDQEGAKIFNIYPEGSESNV